MSVAKVNGLSFHVQKLGTRGSHVVFAHGLLIDSITTAYLTLGPRLAKHHQVTLFDARGHGLTERPSHGYHIDDFAGDLGQVCETVAAGARTIIAFSFGCAVALHYAIKNPQRVEKLILIEGPLPFFSVEWARSMLEKPQDSILAMLPPRHRETFEKLVSNREDGRESPLLRQVHGLLRETTLLEDLARQSDLRDEDLATVQAPTLLLYGEESRLLPEASDRLSGILPDARLEVLAGGHFLIMDCADQIADLCEGFLRE